MGRTIVVDREGSDECPGRHDNLAITAAHDGLAARRSIVLMSNVGGLLDSSGSTTRDSLASGFTARVDV